MWILNRFSSILTSPLCKDTVFPPIIKKRLDDLHGRINSEWEKDEIITRDYQSLLLTSSIPPNYGKYTHVYHTEPDDHHMSKYKVSRIDQAFPFDPTTTIDEDHFKNYFKMLHSECKKATSWNQACHSGLLHALYTMLMIKNNEPIKMAVEILLHELLSHIKDQKKYLIQQSNVLPPPINHKDRTLQGGKHSLMMLPQITSPSTDEKTWLGELAKALNKEVLKCHDIHGDLIFDNSRPEMRDITIANHFDFLRGDIKIAQGTVVTDYSVQKDSPPNLLKLLTDKCQKETDHLSFQEFCILNAISSALTYDPVSNIQFRIRKRSIPSIQELCVLFARPKALDDLSKKYPNFPLLA